MLSEGNRRCLAQSLVGSGCKSEEATRAFQESLANGIDAIITQERYMPLVLKELGIHKEDWSVALVEAGYGLLLKSIETNTKLHSVE